MAREIAYYQCERKTDELPAGIEHVERAGVDGVRVLLAKKPSAGVGQ